MKKYLFLLMLAAAACSPKTAPAGSAEKAGSDIVILYDNDVHCAVDGYASMAALKAEKLTVTPYVTLVSSGDFVQGGSLGAASKGSYIVDIMNAAGYDIVTLGNHEFDYGIPRLRELTGMLEAATVCCNLIDLRENRRMFAPWKMMDYGGTKVAFIGVATPYSFSSSTPAYFQDEKGDYVYSLCADTFYDNVQNFVEDARSQGADYVIALTHLGFDLDYDPINAHTLATNTSGIDVILDGHSHSTVASLEISNKTGGIVHYSQTGAHMDNVGVLTISPGGKISTALVPVREYGIGNPGVQAVIDSLKQEYSALGARRIGRSEVLLPAKDENGDWLVRKHETSLGDFCADAFRITNGADIGLVGGGSLRSNLPAGDIRFDDIFNVFPFNNTVCMASLSGNLLLDVLEYSVSAYPTDFGGFLHVSGISYEFDPSVESPVVFDINKAFVRIDEGPRRVKNVKILNSKTGAWEAIDPAGNYSVAGTTYLLRDAGDGYGMLKGMGRDTGIPDVDQLEKYIVEQLGGNILLKDYGTSAGRVSISRAD